MNKQKQAKKIQKFGSCVICQVQPARSDTAKTCCQSCAGKLAWETRSHE